jgi:hypothetical protein
VLLYASMDTEARDERVEVRQPVLWSSTGTASIILRPVSLPHLAELLDRDGRRSLSIERQRWAEGLVALRSVPSCATSNRSMPSTGRQRRLAPSSERSSNLIG